MSPASAKTFSIPAPTGMNLVDSPGKLQPGECLVMTNLIRAELGCQIRSGYRNWVTSVGAGVPVRSVFGFEGGDPANNRLFSATADGIYDVTSSGASPTRVYAFGVGDTLSGYIHGCNFTTLSGEHYYLAGDESNGYLVYKESTDAWTKPTSGTGAGQIDGLDPDDVVFVTTWKKRVWFVKKNSTIAYYLPVDQYAGTVEAFDFGAQFQHGGYLVGLWSWTVDGAAGIDDRLVAVSSAGDVVIYEGTDPAYFPEIKLQGVWYIGSVPAGRKLGTSNGGELLLLSSMGVIPMGRLTSGASTAADTTVALTRKISPSITKLMQTSRLELGWSTQIHPEDSMLMVLTPKISNQPYTQWVMSVNEGTWSKLADLPMTCAESWMGKLYFGTVDGRVCINDGHADDRSNTPIAIEASVVHGYTDGDSGSLKRLLMARPRLIATSSAPSYRVEGRTNFSRSEVKSVSPTTNPESTWDSGVWDVATWGAGEFEAGSWQGITGYGVYVSLAMRLASKGNTVIAGYDVMLDTGGIL